MKKLITLCCLTALVISVPKCASATIVQDNTDGKVYNYTVNKISLNMKSLLDSCNIYIIDDSINSLPNFKKEATDSMGVYCGDTKDIYVSTKYGATAEVSHILSHELGHALDGFTKEDEKMNDEIKRVYYIAGWVGKYSNTAEFKSLQKDYYSTLLPYSQEAYFNDINEFFAESYAIYVEKPELRSKAIKLYEYYDKVTLINKTKEVQQYEQYGVSQSLQFL